MKKLAIAGLSLLIVLALVAPYVTGSIAESSWDDLNREFNSSVGGVAALETVEYDRSYLGTSVLSRLTLFLPEVEEPVEVYLRSDISHGLLSARSETRLDPERHDAWLEYFDQGEPVLVSQVGLARTLDGTLSVPALTRELAQGGKLASQALEAQFVVSDDGNSVHLTLGWDGMVLEDAEKMLRVGAVSAAEDMSRLTDQIWVGDISFSIAEVSGRLPEGDSFALETLTLLGTTRESDQGRLTNQIDFGIETITLDDEPFGDMRVAFLAEELDTEAMNAVLEAGNRLNDADLPEGNGTNHAAEQLKLFGEVMTEVRNLVARGLTIAIPTFVMTTPEGPVELEFRFVHPQLEPDQREDMVSLLQHSKGGLDLKLPSALVENAPPEVGQQIYQLYQQGLIREENGQLLLNIELDQMTLNVNGQALRIPPLI